jgi:hypothetical protein
MTNAEKYLKEGVTPEEVKEAFFKWYFSIERIEERIDKVLERFFKDTCIPTLTEDERVILRNVQPEWKTIFRGNLGMLELHNENGGWTAFYPMSHLFQFIKERRRIFY